MILNYQFIYWHEKTDFRGYRFCNVHYLQNNTSYTLEDYMRMIQSLSNELHIDINPNYVQIGKVYESVFCKDWAIIALNLYLPKLMYLGWAESDNLNFEYKF